MGNLEADRHTGGTPCEDEGTDHGDAANRPRKAKDCEQNARNEAKGTGKILSQGAATLSTI